MKDIWKGVGIVAVWSVVAISLFVNNIDVTGIAFFAMIATFFICKEK